MKPDLLAYCGLHCSQCSFKTAHDLGDARHLDAIPYPFTRMDLSTYNCEGCKGFCICGPCKIKPCAQSKGITSCAECQHFPCQHTLGFENDGMPHHAQAVLNLHYIKEHGLSTWFEQLAPTLTCPCGQRQTWYYTCNCQGRE